MSQPSAVLHPKPMPVLFIGHGSPMNAIEASTFSRGWEKMARELPRPRAILCISAHWESEGTQVTAMEQPRTIHDFGGFPKALFDVQYPAPGSPVLAKSIQATLSQAKVGLNLDWGLDHGCWSLLKPMYPKADIPVVQLSLDVSKSPSEHYELAKGLAPLREQGILILGSGNLVHNLRRMAVKGSDFNEPFGFDWALEANVLFKKLIKERRHQELADYLTLGEAVQLAVPTPEHFLPLLYILALQQQQETVTFFNDQPVAGSLTMTSLIVGH